MANRSRSTFRRGISETQRRKKAWIDMNVAPVFGENISGGGIRPPDLVAPGDSLTLLQFPSQPGLLESTILRIRGILSVPKSSYGRAAGGTTSFCFGIGIVSDSAADALAVPNPATATGYDWDGWLFLRQNVTVPVDPAGEIVDVKAMRKWKSGDSIVFVGGLATSQAAGELGLTFDFSLRGLFLLP